MSPESWKRDNNTPAKDKSAAEKALYIKTGNAKFNDYHIAQDALYVYALEQEKLIFSKRIEEINKLESKDYDLLFMLKRYKELVTYQIKLFNEYRNSTILISEKNIHGAEEPTYIPKLGISDEMIKGIEMKIYDIKEELDEITEYLQKGYPKEVDLFISKLEKNPSGKDN